MFSKHYQVNKIMALKQDEEEVLNENEEVQQSLGIATSKKEEKLENPL